MGELSCINPIDALLSDSAQAYSMVGSPEYMAPEIVAVGLADTKEKGYDETADWWSVGILFFEMLYGSEAFFLSMLRLLHLLPFFSFRLHALHGGHCRRDLL